MCLQPARFPASPPAQPMTSSQHPRNRVPAYYKKSPPRKKEPPRVFLPRRATPSLLSTLFYKDSTYLENLRQELSKTRALWIGEELLRAVLFLDDPVINEHDTVGNLSGKSHLMCYYHHCHAIFSKLFHHA